MFLSYLLHAQFLQCDIRHFDASEGVIFQKLFATSIKNKPWMSYYSKLKHVLILGDTSEFNDVTAQLVICVAKRRKQEEIVKLSWIMTQNTTEDIPSINNDRATLRRTWSSRIESDTRL